MKKNLKNQMSLVMTCLTVIISYAQPNKSSSKGPSVIYTWNEIMTDAKKGEDPTGNLISPMAESRIYAMVALGMHNCINAIKPKYKKYYFNEKGYANADFKAAIAQSTHDIISSEWPWQKQVLADKLKQTLASITNGKAKDLGVELGHKAATAILEQRKDDGSLKAQYPVEPGTKPGEYRFTTPFDGPPFNTAPYKGFFAMPGWGKLRPFGLLKGDQFRPGKPYDVSTEQYAADFNEIKLKGCENCPTRTADQTELGKFWVESSPLGWNRIARTIAMDRHLDTYELVRLFALLHVAIADSYIGSLEAKSYYYYWRPVTAIHMAADDQNSKTEPDPSWKELGFPTPPIPDYPSAHACAGGAAAEAIIHVLGKDKINFSTTSTSLPGVTRAFHSISEASKENADSRIYIGYHFRLATSEGEKLGKNVGKYVSTHMF